MLLPTLLWQDWGGRASVRCLLLLPRIPRSPCPLPLPATLPATPAPTSPGRSVLRPGGRLPCLELSKVVVPGMQQLYDLYSFNVIPQVMVMHAPSASPLGPRRSPPLPLTNAGTHPSTSPPPTPPSPLPARPPPHQRLSAC